jgi:hypothetical protein
MAFLIVDEIDYNSAAGRNWESAIAHARPQNEWILRAHVSSPKTSISYLTVVDKLKMTGGPKSAIARKTPNLGCAELLA